ncbi:MAG: TlpA disulfide reductase family protein [Verrucomicrobiae bacterium]|nr:TlpA disulfide reductase family protein [Verrucomicrobiae bacterium]
MKTIRSILMKPAWLVAAGGLLLCQPVDAGLKPGDNFLDLTAYKLEGKLPDDLKGKIVIVDFWASWCGPCKESFPVLNELQKKYGGKGVLILAINEDEEKSDMADFLKDNPATFTVVRDAAQKLVAAAGIQTMPSSFVLDATGQVKFFHNGFHGAATRKQYVEELESLLKK